MKNRSSSPIAVVATAALLILSGLSAQAGETGEGKDTPSARDGLAEVQRDITKGMKDALEGLRGMLKDVPLFGLPRLDEDGSIVVPRAPEFNERLGDALKSLEGMIGRMPNFAAPRVDDEGNIHIDRLPPVGRAPSPEKAPDVRAPREKDGAVDL